MGPRAGARGPGYDGPMGRLELPGADVINSGLADLNRGEESVASLLVLIGRPRLTRLGFDLPSRTEQDPEKRLYELLVEEDAAGAHSRYNALIRLLVSFERAAECVG
ncbi:hypothetical protein BH23ACT12_BH23ACT12_15830 [soil metagenome]